MSCPKCAEAAERVNQQTQLISELRGALDLKTLAYSTLHEATETFRAECYRLIALLEKYAPGLQTTQDEQVTRGSGSSVGALCGENIAPAVSPKTPKCWTCGDSGWDGEYGMACTNCEKSKESSKDPAPGACPTEGCTKGSAHWAPCSTQTVTTEKCKRCGGWHSCVHEAAPTATAEEVQGLKDEIIYLREQLLPFQLAAKAPAADKLTEALVSISRYCGYSADHLGADNYTDPGVVMAREIIETMRDTAAAALLAPKVLSDE